MISLHASPVQIGMLRAAVYVPHLVLGLPAGVWVDRWPYRRLLVLGDAARFLVVLTFLPTAAFVRLFGADRFRFFTSPDDALPAGGLRVHRKYSGLAPVVDLGL